MARKLNLGGLFNNGNLTHTLSPFTEDGGSSGVSSMFDSSGKSAFLKINKAAGDTVFHTLTFTTPILSKKILIRISTHECNISEIFINGNFSNTQSDEFTVTDNTPPSNNPTVSNFTFTTDSLTSVKVTYDNIFNADAYISSFEIFIIEESDSNSFEFNDSVLTTKAWNSSRYDGRQLKAVKGVNRATIDDIGNNNKTPIVRNNVRTFYIASNVISLHETDQAERHSLEYGGDLGRAENDTLHTIPGFSYLLIDRAITVNEDDSIELLDINSFPSIPNTDNPRLKGFQREFQSNIQILDRINVQKIGASTDNNLKPFYNVFFNGGRLQEVFRVRSLSYGSQGSLLQTDVVSDGGAGPLKIYETNPASEPLLISNVTPSLFATIYSGSFIDIAKGSTAGNLIRYNLLETINQRIIEGKRIFATFGSGSRQMNIFTGNINGADTFQPLIIKNQDQVYSGSTAYGASQISAHPDIQTLLTNDLAQLSTFELKSGYDASTGVGGSFPIKGSPTRINSTNGTPFTRGPHNGYRSALQTFKVGNFTASNPVGPDFIISGSLSISVLNDETPALLVDLDKPNELIDGRDTPIIVLPTNLHPFIKDNIIHFTAKSGIDIGNITIVPSLNENNRNLL